MITAILGSLGERLGDLASQTEGVGGAGIMSMFGTGVPTFFFQAIVGLYVVQIVFILTILINGIQNGVDKLNERFLIGRNLIRASITYSIISFVVIMLFNIIAGSILGSVTQSLV